MLTIRGAYTALITPFSEDGSAVDLDRLAQNVAEQAAAGVAGVVPCGTTGEAPTLSEAEHRAVVETTIQAARPLGLQVIAGAGSNDTAHAVRLHRLATEAGADAALQVVPYYNKPSQEGLYRHFMTVADASNLPIVLYNIPSRTGVTLSIDTIERLAERAPDQVIAIKDATGDLDTASAISARTSLALVSGDDSLTLPIASVGGAGVISVLANLLPEKVRALCDAFLGESWQTARALHLELFDLARGLLSLQTNPVPVKAALALVGRDTGTVRPPLAPADERVTESLAGLLASHELRPIAHAV